MPPHCDSLDGPVVTAARVALDQEDVGLVLPYVPEEGEDEVRGAFELVVKARAGAEEAREVADRWFFETVVRIHRAGEVAPFTGLKPAGLDVGPVIPVAERALDQGSPTELVDLLCATVQEQVEARHARAATLGVHADEGVAQARAHVQAMLDLQVWAHNLYLQAIGDSHAGGIGHEHG